MPSFQAGRASFEPPPCVRWPRSPTGLVFEWPATKEWSHPSSREMRIICTRRPKRSMSGVLRVSRGEGGIPTAAPLADAVRRLRLSGGLRRGYTPGPGCALLRINLSVDRRSNPGWWVICPRGPVRFEPFGALRHPRADPSGAHRADRGGVAGGLAPPPLSKKSRELRRGVSRRRRCSAGRCGRRLRDGPGLPPLQNEGSGGWGRRPSRPRGAR